MGRIFTGRSVFDEAVERMRVLYAAGHRIVVSFSTGKDSTCALNVCIEAARLTNRLPVEVVMRDEEIMFPGSYEFAERTASRPEVSFTWLVANQPVVNVFNRANPYFWVFDPKLSPDKWVRQPSKRSIFIKELSIDQMTTPKRFPPSPGKDLYAVIGLRVQESRGRLYGLYSSGGYTTKPNQYGVINARPIYDWNDGDVWKAIADNKWDYNHAYDTMHTMGTRRDALRIGPPTMNAACVRTLPMAQSAWPKWFDKVAERCPGVRSAAQFGKRAVLPQRRLGETWKEVFHRECIDKAPAVWIKERSIRLRDSILSGHAHHSGEPLPESQPCYTCMNRLGSWRVLANTMYGGDPFSVKAGRVLPFMEPEFFRPGAGFWGGAPSF